MQNKLVDLNNHLFVQLERLMDDEICKDEESTKLEIMKTSAVTDIAKQIIDVGRTQISAMRFAKDWNVSKKDLPLLLE